MSTQPFELRPPHEMPYPCIRKGRSSIIQKALFALIAAKVEPGEERPVVRVPSGTSKKAKAYMQRTAHNYAERMGIKISTSTDRTHLWIKYERHLLGFTASRKQ